MSTRYFALVAGIAYVGAGLLGFLPAITPPAPPDAPHLAVNTGYGYLLGLFPINIVHNLVHLALGIWGVMAYGSFSGARAYARSLTLIYGLLAVMGLFPTLNTTFGLVPLFGHDIWLHALTALAAAYFGFLAPAETELGASDARTGKVGVWDDRPGAPPRA